MSFKTDLIALLIPRFNNGDVFITVTPDGYNQRYAFGILQGVGGDVRMYVDQSLPDLIHRRVQVWIWGEDLLEVEAKMELVYATLLGSINDPLTRFVGVEPKGGPTDDYNDVLKLHGTRQDFGIHWKYPV